MASFFESCVEFLSYTFNSLFGVIQGLFTGICLNEANCRLLDDYESQYGESHPNIFVGTFDEAKASAYGTRKLLLVYIHSSDNDEFCKDVLSDNLIIELINFNYVFYIEYYQGSSMYKLSSLLNARPPHLTVLWVPRPTTIDIINRFDGNINYTDFVSFLLNGICYKDDKIDKPPSRGVTRISECIADTPASNFTKLKEEQDEEFRRAVEIDRTRLAELNEKRQEEAKKRDKFERERKEKLENRMKVKENRKLLAKTLKSLDAGDTKIKVRLPSGQTLESYFDRNDSVESIYKWVEASEVIHNLKIPYEFTLSTPFPSKVLSDKSQSLESASLIPNASILLTSLDDTSEEED